MQLERVLSTDHYETALPEIGTEASSRNVTTSSERQ